VVRGDYFFWLGASADEDCVIDLRAAADFIGTDGASLHTDDADRIAATLRRLSFALELIG
jgi:hypothetical protein